MADRPRVKSAYQAFQLNGRAAPVEARFILVQFVCVGGQAVVLHFANQTIAGQAADCLNHRLRAETGEPVVQAATGIFGRNGRADLEQHRPCVQAGFHLHHGNARLSITGLHRALDRCGATPAWQQRGVTVDTAQARDIQHHLRQDQAVSHHHHQIGPECR